MTNYKSSAELKALAREQLFGKYTTVIGAGLLMTICIVFLILISNLLTDTSSVVGTIIFQITNFVISLLTGIFSSGMAFLYLKLVCGQQVVVSDIFYGFRFHPDKALSVQFWISLLTYASSLPSFICTLLYTSTGNVMWYLVASIFWVFSSVVIVLVNLNFAPVFYLLHDFPNYSVKTLLKMSFHLMKGSKGRLFYMWLSFIPLFLLSLLSCCIANLWIAPYVQATSANFYMDLMQNKGKTASVDQQPQVNTEVPVQ